MNDALGRLTGARSSIAMRAGRRRHGLLSNWRQLSIEHEVVRI